MTAAYLGLLSSTARINAFLTSNNLKCGKHTLLASGVGTRGGAVWSGGLVLVLRTWSLLPGRTSTRPPPICPTSPCPYVLPASGVGTKGGVEWSGALWLCLGPVPVFPGDKHKAP